MSRATLRIVIVACLVWGGLARGEGEAHVRSRHFGLLANRGRAAKLARCRELLGAPSPADPPAPESVAALMLRVTGVDLTRCPVCRVGRLHRVGVFPPGDPPVPGWDTS